MLTSKTEVKISKDKSISIWLEHTREDCCEKNARILTSEIVQGPKYALHAYCSNCEASKFFGLDELKNYE